VLTYLLSSFHTNICIFQQRNFIDKNIYIFKRNNDYFRLVDNKCAIPLLNSNDVHIYIHISNRKIVNAFNASHSFTKSTIDSAVLLKAHD